MKNVIVLILFVGLTFSGYAKLEGRLLTDSLERALMVAQQDTNKVNLLNKISDNFDGLDFDSARVYGNQALELSKALLWGKGTVNGYNNIGTICQCLGNYPEATRNFKIAIQFAMSIAYPHGAVAGYCNLGCVDANTGNYPSALEHFFSAMKVAEKNGDDYAVAVCCENIGNIYDIQCDYADALKYYDLSIAKNGLVGNRKVLAEQYNNVGLVYLHQHDLKKADESLAIALKIADELGIDDLRARIYANLGDIHFAQNDYAGAVESYTTALQYADQIGDKASKAYAYQCIGNALEKQGKHSAAEKYCNMAVVLDQELGDLEKLKNTYFVLSDVYANTGRPTQSLECFKTYTEFKDSIYSKDNEKKIVQQEMQYEYEKKEAAAKLDQEKKDAAAALEIQRQKWVRNGFGGGFAIVLMFAGIFLVQRNTIKTGKRKSDELLLNILPAEVAEELKTKGSADAKLIEQVTVLFTDFKGFTQLSEQMSPQDLVAEINACFSAFDKIMQQYRVEKIKTIGDAYMAAGGLPTPNATHAVDVVKAALAIQEYMARDKALKTAQNKLHFEIRIGVHTGPVVAGIVGIKKFQYDIWGDTVNTASRMESSGEVGQVNISASTFELVKDRFACSHRGKVTAKGKGEIDMYFIAASKG